MVSGITPCAQECKWTDYFGEPPKLVVLVMDSTGVAFPVQCHVAGHGAFVASGVWAKEGLWKITIINTTKTPTCLINLM
jgi:hypothetical protein